MVILEVVIRRKRELEYFIESKIMNIVYSQPNKTVLNTIKEDESDMEFETLDLDW